MIVVGMHSFAGPPARATESAAPAPAAAEPSRPPAAPAGSHFSYVGGAAPPVSMRGLEAVMAAKAAASGGDGGQAFASVVSAYGENS